MIKFLQAFLPGIAGSIAFLALDTLLLKWEGSVRVIGMVVAFLLLAGASLAVMGRHGGSSRRVGSGRVIGGDLDDRFGRIRVRRGDDVDILSGNRVKGSARTSVDTLDIE